MTAIVVKTFDGLKPIVKPLLIGVENAQVAKNVRLISGALAPLRGVSNLKATVTGSPKSIHRYGSSATETDYWLEFSQDTDVMRSPIANDQWDRLYWTDGDNRPRYAPNNMILSGTHYPGASYELGLPEPTTKVQITSFSAPITYTKVTREYVMTFYAPSTGKESTAGPVMSVLSVDGQKVSFTALPTSNRGDTSITKKRLYRKVSGTYRLVVELDLDVTTYDDSATDASLASAAALSAAIGSAPPSPTRAPTASAPSTTNAVTSKSRSYVYTVKNITYGDEYYVESSPSPARVITADNTQTVTLTGFSSSAGAASGNGFRIYRKDPDSASYLLVADIPGNQTSFSDVIGQTTLGSPLATTSPTSYAPAQPTASVNTSTESGVVRRVYMVTFVDGSNVESSKSPVSEVVSVVDGVTVVSLSHSETVPAGVTKKRVYRQTLTGAGMTVPDSAWKMVAEGPSSATSMVDNFPDSSLTVSYAAALQGLPSSPVDTAVSNATIPSDQIPESRTYVYTYVSAYGEEGPPSAASDVTDVNPDETVVISLGGAPTGNYNVTLKRIYRSSTVGSVAKFQYVAEIPVGQTSYSDSVTQDELGEVLPSELWVAPPAGLKGLRMMANGAAVGFLGRTLYLSEPNLPHAWPHQYTIDDDIVGIGVFGQSVAVLTKSFPYLFQGIDPAAMSQNKLKLPQACVAKRSVIETGDGVVYASPDGLVSIGSNVGVITQNLYSRDQWQAFVPSSMECYTHNGRVLIAYNNGTDRGILVIDVSGQGATLTTTDINTLTPVTAGYYEPKTDTMYFAQGGNIVRYDLGSALTMVWRSKVFRLFAPENLAVAQVRATAYPVTLKVYADGALKHTQTVTSNDQFRLPAGFKGLDWEFQLEGVNEVTEVIIASSATELRLA